MPDPVSPPEYLIPEGAPNVTSLDLGKIPNPIEAQKVFGTLQNAQKLVYKRNIVLVDLDLINPVKVAAELGKDLSDPAQKTEVEDVVAKNIETRNVKTDPTKVAAELGKDLSDPAQKAEVEDVVAQRKNLQEKYKILYAARDARLAAKAAADNEIAKIEDELAKKSPSETISETLKSEMRNNFKKTFYDDQFNFHLLSENGEPLPDTVNETDAYEAIYTELQRIASEGQGDPSAESAQAADYLRVLHLSEDKKSFAVESLEAFKQREIKETVDHVIELATAVKYALNANVKTKDGTREVMTEKTSDDGKTELRKNEGVDLERDVEPNSASAYLTFLIGQLEQLPSDDLERRKRYASYLYQEFTSQRFTTANMKSFQGDEQLVKDLKALKGNQILDQALGEMKDGLMKNFLIPNRCSDASMEHIFRDLILAHLAATTDGAIITRPNTERELSSNFKQMARNLFDDYDAAGEDKTIIGLSANDDAGRFLQNAMLIDLKSLNSTDIVNTLVKGTVDAMVRYRAKIGKPLDEKSIEALHEFESFNLSQGMAQVKKDKNLGPLAMNGLLLLFMFMPQLTALFAEDGTEKGQQPG